MDVDFNGVFTLPDIETVKETERNPDTDKWTQNPMRICVGSVSVQYKYLYTILCNYFFISPFVGIGVGQCEHTISGFSFAKSLPKRHVENYWHTDQEDILDLFLRYDRAQSPEATWN